MIDNESILKKYGIVIPDDLPEVTAAAAEGGTSTFQQDEFKDENDPARAAASELLHQNKSSNDYHASRIGEADCEETKHLLSRAQESDD